jgi:hypothetical protein
MTATAEVGVASTEHPFLASMNEPWGRCIAQVDVVPGEPYRGLRRCGLGEAAHKTTATPYDPAAPPRTNGRGHA